jgi:hypothetical protein
MFEHLALWNILPPSIGFDLEYVRLKIYILLRGVTATKPQYEYPFQGRSEILHGSKEVLLQRSLFESKYSPHIKHKKYLCRTAVESSLTEDKVDRLYNNFCSLAADRSSQVKKRSSSGTQRNKYRKPTSWCVHY